MSTPYVYIGIYTIQPGKQEQARNHLRELVAHVEANEPRLVCFHVYFDDRGSKVSIVQVHPDAESMEEHLKVVSDHMTACYDYLEAGVSEHEFGEPTPSLTSTLQQWVEPGVPVTELPDFVGGFTRSSAA